MNSNMANNSRLPQKVVDFISNHHFLASINLGWNNIGKEGAIAISEALKYNNTITDINLCSNNIGNEGATAISEALKHNHTITYIDLGGNNIYDEETMTLIDDQLNRNIQIPYVLYGYCFYLVIDLFACLCVLLYFYHLLFVFTWIDFFG